MISAGCTISFASAGSAAINSFGASIAYSAIFCALGLAPFVLCSLLRVRGFAFPAVWATWWWFIASESPVGRLGAWSPLTGYEAYVWTRPFIGEFAIDWAIGGWCEVLASFGAELIMGHKKESDEMTMDEEPALFLPLDDEARPRVSKKVVKPASQISIMAFVLVAMTIPSTFINPLPAPLHAPPGETRRDVGVACVLPVLDDLHPPFNVFLEETRAIAGRAHIVLWPEGAVAFDSEEDRNGKLEAVRNASATSGIWIGVGFTDPMPGHGEDAKGKRRNGLAIVSREGVVLEYYKRHLVPLVESFPQVKGTAPPSVINITLGSKKKPSAQWSITLSGSICLDFAHSSHDLESRPSLILGPARTWHTNVGRVMMEMAKQRADELGTRVLWCDGGEGGLSGVVGMGESSLQVGPGTWVQRLSFEIPVEGKRTVFGTVGALLGLGLAWALAFGSVPARYTQGGPSLSQNTLWKSVLDRVSRSLSSRRTQPAPNLLDN
ncbi:hypothetical protein M408DRAFT_327359 [Serendipita vermifera MAFF 305830]|uniref:CN hydrolase domain-containing protein n=1 Tax=Serendipita vermifera MAFF 305830 TaxID=933852 RepID=A0A0C2XST7_SERVB|nr:hypothetical protein M408DRAFT_327359 [Serendipita vermifera MAFF 305830]